MERTRRARTGGWISGVAGVALLLAALGGTASGAPEGAAPAVILAGLPFDRSHLERLAPGRARVVTRERGATGLVRIPAPPERVYATLAAVDDWAEYLPGPRIERVEHLGPDLVRVHQHTERFGIELRYATVHRLDERALRVEIALDHGRQTGLEALGGFWQVLPGAIPGESLLVLHTEVVPKHPVPGFVQRHLVAESVRRNLEAVAARATAPPEAVAVATSR